MSKHNALGRGLGSLLSSSESQYEKALPENQGAQGRKEALEVEIGSVRPNPWQPRKAFDKEQLAELAASIREHGIIQPLIVRRRGLNYELVAGERRLRAARLAKLKTVPVLVRDYTEQQMQEDLNPLEEAQAIKDLMKTMNYTQAQVADRIGRSRTAVANLLRMLNLPAPVRKMVSDGTVTAGQIRPVLALDTKEKQTALAEAIVQHGWSARTAEDVVKAVKEGTSLKVLEERSDAVFAEAAAAPADKGNGKGEAGKDGKGKKARRKDQKGRTALADVHYKQFEDDLVGFLGTKVRIVPKNDNVGTIEIDYYSADDLDRLCELLQGRPGAENKGGSGSAGVPWLRPKFNV